MPSSLSSPFSQFMDHYQALKGFETVDLTFNDDFCLILLHSCTKEEVRTHRSERRDSIVQCGLRQ